MSPGVGDGPGSRPEAWIHRRPEDEVAAEVAAARARAAADGQALPLAGLTVAVKDNIDVAGLPTTAGCPAYAYTPHHDAPAVARLRAAGAVVAGKTNLDQFATGLVGTRSPYGTVRDARDPARISGGSSSGSAVAVAVGDVDLALGTDTAGSGRVPAAFQGIVGAKPSLGLVPVDGVVPACRSFDCVSLFAREVALARRALAVISAPIGNGPAAAPPAARLATFPDAALAGLSAGYRRAFAATLARLQAAGHTVDELDPGPFLRAGALLYGGAFLAERYAAVGEFIEAQRSECNPVVADVVLGGRRFSAADYVQDWARLDRLRRHCSARLAGFDALILPTAPFQPAIADVAADPIGLNVRLGTFTTFCNLLDLCAYAVPAGGADGGCFGVSVLAPRLGDQVAADIAAMVEGVPFSAQAADGVEPPPAGTIPLLVVGAHLSGLPLNHELTGRGARLLGAVQTAAAYRLYALATDLPKPGLARGGAARITGELWALAPAALADLLAALPSPMALGPVTLADGTRVTGFLCEPAAIEGATEITRFGGWREYLAATGADSAAPPGPVPS